MATMDYYNRRPVGAISRVELDGIITDIAKNKAVRLSVKDYGAIGDGITDETIAVTAALAAITAAGGGTLVFPPGSYWWPSPHTAQLSSNTTIEGDKATLVKRLPGDSTEFFCIKSGGAVGYGSGATNVRFTGLTVKGDFASGRTAGLLGANHGSNILVENCVFEQCQGNGHIMDLGGCENVTVKDSIFKGGYYANSADRYNECIQADNSTYIGSSALDTPESYDGLPSRNITVQNNKFLPITVNSVAYPAPVPFGSHYSLVDQYHSNLVFTDNVVDTPGVDVDSQYRGILHFRGATGIKVTRNRFINRGGVAVSAVRTYALLSAGIVADAGLAAPVQQTLATPMVCSDIEVSGNTFIGFSNTDVNQSIINIYGDQASGTNVAGVKIADNRFEGCFSDYTLNTGSNLIEIIDAVDVEVARNRMDGGRRLLYFQDVDRIAIRDNEINKTGSGVAVNGTRATMLKFTGNTINDYAGGFLISASVGVLVQGNQFRGERTGSFTSINIGGTSSRFIVTANDIVSTVAGSKAILIQQTSTSGTVRGNIISATGIAISITADSTATLDNRVDQTAGRAIYTWDNVNNREQLAYGDTGWRDVSAVTAWTDAIFPAGVVTASGYPARVRRIGYNIELHFGIDKAASGTPSAAAAIPLGFRPVSGAAVAAIGGTSGLALFRAFHSGGTSLLVIQSTVAITGGSITITYSTNDPWPTALPGTAISTIPNL